MPVITAAFIACCIHYGPWALNNGYTLSDEFLAALLGVTWGLVLIALCKYIWGDEANS